MRFFLLLTLLLSFGLVRAEPTTPPAASNDEITRLINDRGFLARIGDVGNKVGSRASELVMNSMAFLHFYF